MRGFLPDREDEIVAKVPLSLKVSEKFPAGRYEYDPAGVVTEKTYKLRFSMRELQRAERHFKEKALAPGGVKAILDKLLDGTLDAFLLALYYMLERNHPELVVDEELWAICEADFGRVESAVYAMVGRAMPEPEAEDPNAQPAATTPNETEQPSTPS